MIRKANRSFSVKLELDFYHDPRGDEEVAKGGSEPGSFWQCSISDIIDVDGKVLNTQSAFQWEAMVKSGGLTKLLKDLVPRIPRFIDENGLPCK